MASLLLLVCSPAGVALRAAARRALSRALRQQAFGAALEPAVHTRLILTEVWKTQQPYVAASDQSLMTVCELQPMALVIGYLAGCHSPRDGRWLAAKQCMSVADQPADDMGKPLDSTRSHDAVGKTAPVEPAAQATDTALPVSRSGGSARGPLPTNAATYHITSEVNTVHHEEAPCSRP
jgi:hypothetical protein